MANIHDYIKWRGDLPINDQFPFNELDNLVLARLSYMIFNKITMTQVETIGSVSDKMKDFLNEEFIFNGDKELITLLGMSNRFKNMIITDYVQNNDASIEQQFSAITIHISESEIYVSYCGTDSSILGWKEDFNLAYMENIPAQFSGLEYIKSIASKYVNTRIHVGGHSKGGNVAIYAAIFADESIQNRIIDVVNYDGPGFDQKILDSIPNPSIIDKITTYLPQGSVIGRLMEHKGKIFIVHSDAKGILQHDIFSWSVMKDEFIRFYKWTNGSEIMNNSVCEWLKNTTPEKRKIFIDSIFELLYSTSAETFNGFTKVLVQKLPTIIKTYSNLSDEDKSVMIEMLKLFIKSYYDSLKSTGVSKVKTLKINDKNNRKRGDNVE